MISVAATTSSSAEEISLVAGTAVSGLILPQQPAGQRHGFAPECDLPLWQHDRSESLTLSQQLAFGVEQQPPVEEVELVWTAS